MTEITEELARLYIDCFGERVDSIEPLPLHGSSRQRYRLQSGGHSVIGVFNEDVAENIRFHQLAEHFKHYDLPVPAVYIRHDSIYLEQDLGSTTLFDLVKSHHNKETNAVSLVEIEYYYKKSLSYLIKFQITAGQKISDQILPSKQVFDCIRMQQDFSLFRKELLERVQVPFNNELLAVDFERLADYLDTVDKNFFLYRDFQSRNIMVKDKDLFFIDFQSGMHGALPYDIASLLYQAQARLPESLRQSLLDYYLDELGSVYNYNRNSFIRYYRGFVFLRLIQVLGTYGKLGLGLDRSYFKLGLPYAIELIINVIKNYGLPIPLPELQRVLLSLDSVSW